MFVWEPRLGSAATAWGPFMSAAKFTGEVRWGILGAANIVGRQFLPGLREAGGGRAVLVASRDGHRAEVSPTSTASTTP